MIATNHQDGPTEGYAALLKNGGFQAFLWTQFLGAFNDNVFKMIVSVMAVDLAADQAASGQYLALAGAVFVLPFLLFAGYAGQVADRFSKTRVLQITKLFEIVVMLLAIGALMAHSINGLLAVLFLLALQANFFSPAKYGVLPEMVGERQLSRANGLLELSTFAAIVLGTSCGTFLFQRWRGEPLTMGLALLTIAVLGSLISWKMPRTKAAGNRTEPMRFNPFHEIWQGAKRLRSQPGLGASVLGMSFFWFLGGLFQMAMLLVGRETLHVTEVEVGLLLTALAVGISIGSVAAGRFSGDHIELGLVPAGAALMGVAAIAVGLSHTYTGAMPWLTLVGLGGGLFIVPLNAYLQERAGAAEKGRLLATNNFVNMIGVVLASGALSLLHDRLHWTASHIVVALGMLTLVTAAVAVYAAPIAILRLVLLGLTRLLFRVRVIGREHLPREGGAVLIANHVSYADALLLGSLMPRLIRFLMWQPIYDLPLLRPFFRMLGAIPLAPESPKAALRALKLARTELTKGELVCIFPEGGLTRTGQVMPFQRGVERMTANTGAPIIPIHLDGLWGHPFSRKPGARWSFGRCAVTLRIGAPIVAETITAADLQQHVVELAAANEVEGTLAETLVRTARRCWKSKAIIDSTGKELTYGDTLTAALLLSEWIETNATDQPFIGLLLPASVGGALANLGVAMSGRTSVNLNFTAGEDSLRSALSRCEVRTILTSRAFIEKAKLPSLAGLVYFEDLLPSFSKTAKFRAYLRARFAPVSSFRKQMQSDSLATIIFSSGSTGEPKGVMLTHANLLANVRMVAQVYDVDERDCLLGALPFFHSFGYTFTLWFPLLQGFTAAYHPNPMDAKTIGEMAEQHRATFLLATPTFLQSYLRKCTSEQFRTLRNVLVGAEKLRPALATAFAEKFGVQPMEGYGCTEMSPVVAVNTPRSAQAGSVGRPLPGIVTRIVDPETRELLPQGREGLLLVKGGNRMAGYWRDDERTAQAFCGGYYVTGDLARVDDEGFLYIVDRLARFSKIGGEMVPHVKIEQTLEPALGGAGCCVVVGVPDEQRGERLAVLYVHDAVTPAQLIEQLNAARLPALWIPKRDNFYRVESIPQLGTGKTDLRRARQLAQELTSAEKLQLPATA